MTNYQTGDFLIRLKNAFLAKNKELEVNLTKMTEALAASLVKSGFLESVSKDKNKLLVKLAYKNKAPVLMGIKLVSKPGLRVYMGVDELERIKKPSIFILSTPKGILSSRQAVKARVGGEVIAEVW